MGKSPIELDLTALVSLVLNGVARNDGVEVLGLERVIGMVGVCSQSGILLQALDGALANVGVELLGRDAALLTELFLRHALAADHLFHAHRRCIEGVLHKIGGKFLDEALGEFLADSILVGKFLNLAIVTVHVVADENQKLVDRFEILAVGVDPAVGQLRLLAFLADIDLKPADSGLADRVFGNADFLGDRVDGIIRSKGELLSSHSAFLPKKPGRESGPGRSVDIFILSWYQTA